MYPSPHTPLQAPRSVDLYASTNSKDCIEVSSHIPSGEQRAIDRGRVCWCYPSTSPSSQRAIQDPSDNLSLPVLGASARLDNRTRSR